MNQHPRLLAMMAAEQIAERHRLATRHLAFTQARRNRARRNRARRNPA